MTKIKYDNRKTVTMVYIALFAVMIAICSWISIPTVVPFTLQTFAVFCTVGLLGGKRGHAFRRGIHIDGHYRDTCFRRIHGRRR